MPVSLIPQKAMNRVVSRTPEVRRGVRAEGRARQALAEAARARHFHDRHVQVTGDQDSRWPADYIISMDDDRGQRAVLSIEYGRKGYTVTRPDGSTYTVARMEGLRILRAALVSGSVSGLAPPR